MNLNRETASLLIVSNLLLVCAIYLLHPITVRIARYSELFVAALVALLAALAWAVAFGVLKP